MTTAKTTTIRTTWTDVDICTILLQDEEHAVSGSRLAFRTRELAAYAGRQFTEEWAGFMIKPCTDE